MGLLVYHRDGYALSLYPFQQDLVEQVIDAWQDRECLNVMLTAPTGSGKTVMIADIIQRVDRPTVAIAHRQELLAQLSLALNRESIIHGIVAPKGVITQIIGLHMEVHGYSRYNPRSNTRVAGVDTLIRRDASDPWFNRVELAVIDEGHHVLKSPNKWGRALAMMPKARGLFPTAHAIRGDGAGLGRSYDGLVDKLVVGPCGRDLINMGLLSEYRLLCPANHVDLSNVPVGSNGDFNQQKLRIAVHQDKAIVGDVVGHYLRYAGGKLGITFAVDVESATELAAAYRKAHVSAEVISADTPLSIRGAMMKKFRARQILQLVSVDVLGEGVDVPAVEVISQARPTASFQLEAQQKGRGLRLDLPADVRARWGDLDPDQRKGWLAVSSKPYALLLDHVGNVHRFYEDHNFVDTRQTYTLRRREKCTREKNTDAIPLRTCLECFQPYEAILPDCPHCGGHHVPQGRTKPLEVDGDLLELDPAVMAQMRAKVAEVDAPPIGGNDVVARSIAKNHRLRQQAQETLRTYIAHWAGYWQGQGASDSEIYSRFYFRFEVDILTAQTLGRTDAADLESRIKEHLVVLNVQLPYTSDPTQEDFIDVA